MNPAHIFLISLAVLAVFWLGALIGSDKPEKRKCQFPVYPAAVMLNFAGVVALIASLWLLIERAHENPVPDLRRRAPVGISTAPGRRERRAAGLTGGHPQRRVAAP